MFGRGVTLSSVLLLFMTQINAAPFPSLGESIQSIMGDLIHYENEVIPQQYCFSTVKNLLLSDN